MGSIIFYELFIPAIALLCLLAILFNACVLVTRFSIRVSPSSSLEFSFSLAASDIWTSIVVAVSLIFNSYLPVVHDIKIVNNCFGFWLEAFRTGGMLTGLLHLVALGFSHYVFVAYPLTHYRILSLSTTYLVIVMIWFTPPIGLIIYFFSWPGQGLRDVTCDVVDFYENVFFRLCISSLVVLLMLVTLVFYYKLLRRVVQVRGKIARRGSGGGVRELVKQRRTLTTTGLILGTFALGWLPTAVLFILNAQGMPLYKQASVFKTVLNSCSIILIMAKSLVNPVIYATRIPEIGAFVGRSFPRRWRLMMEKREKKKADRRLLDERRSTREEERGKPTEQNPEPGMGDVSAATKSTRIPSTIN